MTSESWRDEWPPFRIKLVEETARCLADQQALASGGTQPSWAAMSGLQQASHVESIAGLFFVQDIAMHNLISRGEVP